MPFVGPWTLLDGVSDPKGEIGGLASQPTCVIVNCFRHLANRNKESYVLVKAILLHTKLVWACFTIQKPMFCLVIL